MKVSKLAVALAVALATTGAVAQDKQEQAAPSAEAHKFYQAGERELYTEKERARLEREGFPQYNP